MTDVLDIHVPVIPNTGLAEDKDWASFVRREKLLPIVGSETMARIDFIDVEVATQSFVHALIADAFRANREWFLSHVQFANAGPSVQQAVLLVLEYLSDSSRDAG